MTLTKEDNDNLQGLDFHQVRMGLASKWLKATTKLQGLSSLTSGACNNDCGNILPLTVNDEDDGAPMTNREMLTTDCPWRAFRIEKKIAEAIEVGLGVGASMAQVAETMPETVAENGGRRRRWSETMAGDSGRRRWPETVTVAGWQVTVAGGSGQPAGATSTRCETETKDCPLKYKGTGGRTTTGDNKDKVEKDQKTCSDTKLNIVKTPLSTTKTANIGNGKRKGMDAMKCNPAERRELDPMGWIARAETIFQSQGVIEEEKVCRAYISMEGSAGYWVRAWKAKAKNCSWEGLKGAMVGTTVEGMVRQAGGLLEPFGGQKEIKIYDDDVLNASASANTFCCMRSLEAPDWSIIESLILPTPPSRTPPTSSGTSSPKTTWPWMCSATAHSAAANALLSDYDRFKRTTTAGGKLSPNFDYQLFAAVERVVMAHEERGMASPEGDTEAGNDALDATTMEIGSKRKGQRSKFRHRFQKPKSKSEGVAEQAISGIETVKVVDVGTPAKERELLEALKDIGKEGHGQGCPFPTLSTRLFGRGSNVRTQDDKIVWRVSVVERKGVRVAINRALVRLVWFQVDEEKNGMSALGTGRCGLLWWSIDIRGNREDSPYVVVTCPPPKIFAFVSKLGQDNVFRVLLPNPNMSHGLEISASRKDE
ncbi:hypothetical protein V8G54_003196 [Vigna mungo]|uniref:Retrotransposon gag domain-containing protein n=1 Tax=Vigna mungo TaxID=3915 RepID=A0AAQ3PCZ6_VIGMU